MSLEENKALARRANAVFASGKGDFEEIFAPAYVNHQETDMTEGRMDRSLAEYKEMLGVFHSVFSDARNEVLMQVAEGDLVATRWRFTAMLTAEYRGVAPMDHPVTWTGVQIDRIENGRIAESWDEWDKYGLFAQLGLVK